MLVSPAVGRVVGGREESCELLFRSRQRRSFKKKSPQFLEMDVKAEAAVATNYSDNVNQGSLSRGNSIPMLQNKSHSQISHLAIDIGGNSCMLPTLPLCRSRNMNISMRHCLGTFDSFASCGRC